MTDPNRTTTPREVSMKRLQALPIIAIILAGCSNYQNVPPNDIGMMITPTGYEDHIYTPGQVDVGQADASGQMNRLVLIQRSGIEVKEGFLGKEASEDKEDHRCLTGDKAPLTLDVRMLFALPDYETTQGKKDLARIFMLGNPQEVVGTNARVLRISAESVYNEQAKQSVRGKIRQICAQYENFDAVFNAFKNDEGGFTRQIERIVNDVLQERNVPLRLVNAFPSNIKPDPSVIEAIAAQQAAEKRVKAIRTLTDFLDEDKTGSRLLIYQMQTWQEIVNKGNSNGHNTIFFAPGGTTNVLPLPQSK